MTLVKSVEMAATASRERSARGSAMAKSERSAELGFVFAVVIGAVGGAAIWGGLNSVVINGRNVIDGFAWPFNSIFLYAVAGAIINGTAVVLSKRWSESHREELCGCRRAGAWLRGRGRRRCSGGPSRDAALLTMEPLREPLERDERRVDGADV